jgi:type II secretory pathway component HofQ
MNPGSLAGILLSAVQILCVVEISASDVTFDNNEKTVEFFEVHNADIRSVFRQLSAFSGVDIVASENVKGTVTLAVTNKSWKEILSIVCRIENLTTMIDGSYIYVVSNEDFNKQKINDATSVQATQELSPLKREIIKVQNAQAKEMMESIQTLLSLRGKITIVERNNALIIYDTEENISQVRRMITELDVETPQISISCKIIEVSSGAIQRIGVHWGYMDPASNVSVQHIPEGVGFISGALERVAYGIISPENFSAALEYLFTDNQGEIVAQPQVTTMDNKSARIFMGQQIPVKYLDEAGNTVVKMVDAGTELIVKPHISGEGRIHLELSPKKESYTLQDGVPVINEQSANTNVVVNNGETVVIAGLTSNESLKSETGIPILKDIPLIGNLFKRSSKNLDKKDLIIFVTPHIIDKNITSISTQLPAVEQGISEQISK